MLLERRDIFRFSASSLIIKCSRSFSFCKLFGVYREGARLWKKSFLNAIILIGIIQPRIVTNAKDGSF